VGGEEAALRPGQGVVLVGGAALELHDEGPQVEVGDEADVVGGAVTGQKSRDIAHGCGHPIDGLGTLPFGPGGEDIPRQKALQIEGVPGRSRCLPLYTSPGNVENTLWTGGRIAQRLEHLLHTQGVAGSNPASPTTEDAEVAEW
jgi:hypothetical protein